MSIILNGTTLDSSANIIYNGTELKKVIYNGVEVWTKSESMPVRGQLINMDLGNGSKQYRILKMNNTIAEVLAMEDIEGVAFNDSSVLTTFTGDVTSGQKYADSTLDTYLNTTFYDSLSSEAKAAIVPKNITQDMWKKYYSDEISGSDYYAFVYDNVSLGYFDESCGNAPIGERNIYALSLQEVFEYLTVGYFHHQRFSSTLIQEMFWNNEDNKSGQIFLRSASAEKETYVFTISRGAGEINNEGNIKGGKYYRARPAFQIDLSKIDWAITE